MKTAKKVIARKNRHNRVRSKVSGSAERPRLAVFRSNLNTYAQLIDDEKGVTIASVSDLKVKKGNKTEKAVEVGKMIAEKAKENKIDTVVFDRSGYMYQGRVKALAESARTNGLKF